MPVQMQARMSNPALFVPGALPALIALVNLAFWFRRRWYGGKSVAPQA